MIMRRDYPLSTLMSSYRQGSSEGGAAAAWGSSPRQQNVSRAAEEGLSSWCSPPVSRSLCWQVCWYWRRGWLQRASGGTPGHARHHLPAHPRLPRLQSPQGGRPVPESGTRGGVQRQASLVRAQDCPAQEEGGGGLRLQCPGRRSCHCGWGGAQ